MMAKKDRIKAPTIMDVYKSIRKDWHGVNPVTKIERDRTKYTRKRKHPGKETEE